MILEDGPGDQRTGASSHLMSLISREGRGPQTEFNHIANDPIKDESQ